ncbi:esterase family protein [Neptunitalea lumnitzerae]|uniref:Esterase n=1 Tax=Neptunitalea lumnitzerae TaxID=2965509 RepID=A0ABQ5MLL8_9FLAO|nr:alpha/beta hydrolase-fold protein [Neptunitalea sp. Y10]GLB50301.1 esterase [Neptunitalea sp. Y10]
MKRMYHKWFSPNLKKEMELLVYGTSGARVLMFPTRTARFYDYENWRIIEAISPMIENGWIQVFTVDSIDTESLYNGNVHPKERIQRHLQYEAYILNEVMPFSYKLNPNNCLMSVGCSMGAYHAMNIALRHPQWFTKIIALSGRFDVTMEVEGFANLMGGFYDEDIYFHMPSHYISNIPRGAQLRNIKRLEIIIAIGKEDPFYNNNKVFSTKLWDKEIWHALHEWEGRAHSAKYWRNMLPMYL